MSAPIIQPVLIFLTYSLANNTITAAKAFTTIALFNIMRFPFSFLPLGIVQYLQASIAVNRMQLFFERDEINIYDVELEPGTSPTGVEAQGGLEQNESSAVLSISDGEFCFNGKSMIINQ